MNTPHHIKLETIFDTIQDANSVFAAEKKTYDFVINLNKLLIAIVVIELILIITLFPLKEKEPYLVGFSNATQNFVHIEKANETITANEALIRNLLGSYIINRETINHFDDEERYEVIRMQSTGKVWKVFENIVAQENSVYGNSHLTREVKIVNIAKWKNGYANAEVAITLLSQGIIQSQKRYKITIMYKFNTIDIDFDSLPKNPTGFEVQEYAVTEIATIKELEEENKVDPKTQKSKIKKADKSDSNDFLRQYQYNDSSQRQNNEPKPQPQNLPTQSNTNPISNEEYSKLTEREKRQVLLKEIQEMKEKQKQNQDNKEEQQSQIQESQSQTPQNQNNGAKPTPNPFS
ncbi:VirB8 protein [Helicobacter cinaedi CCUG 18818 = ATCC BAA-847]|nr:VirB8 protein [Helicobacter cinaedi CCUG 18818 = ATCC BAA-847]